MAFKYFSVRKTLSIETNRRMKGNYLKRRSLSNTSLSLRYAGWKLMRSMKRWNSMAMLMNWHNSPTYSAIVLLETAGEADSFTRECC